MLQLISAENSDLTWRSIIYDLPRGVLSFAVRSAIDFLPTRTNLKCWGKRTNALCPLCKNLASLSHVLNNCSVALTQGRFTWRHDSILKHIVKLLQASSENPNVKVYADTGDRTSSGGTIPPNILPTAQHSDIYLYNDTEKTAMIAELTVPFETNICKAHERKKNKYASLVVDLNRVGIKTSLICFEVGSRGAVTKANVSSIKSIFKFTKTRFTKKIIKDISKLALLASYGIWNTREQPVWDNIDHLKFNHSIL